MFGLKISGNQPSSFIEAEISPRPIKQNGEAITKAHQKNDVNEQPSQPRRQAAHVHEFQIRDRAYLVAGRLPGSEYSQNFAQPLPYSFQLAALTLRKG